MDLSLWELAGLLLVWQVIVAVKWCIILLAIARIAGRPKGGDAHGKTIAPGSHPPV